MNRLKVATARRRTLALLGSLANGLVLWRRIVAEEQHLMQNTAYRKAFEAKARLVPGVF